MKRLFSVFFAITFIFVTFFAPSAHATDLSDDQKGVISQSCSTIKQSLNTLQRTDSRTRSYLGSAYQTLISDYITPLNVNLARNANPSATISALHSNILNTREEFIQQFTDYSKSFEELLQIDCQTQPEDFYEKLVETRKKRTALASIVRTMHDYLENHYTAVEALEEDL